MSASLGTVTSHSGRHDPDPTPGPRLVYIIGTYPLVTTTFIDREIRALHRLGVQVWVLAVRRPASGATLSSDQRELQRGVRYLLPARWSDVTQAHLHFLVRRPIRYARTLLYLISRSHPSEIARFKTLLHFGEAVYAAWLIGDQRFEELHAHFIDRAATIALVAGRLLNKPYSLSVHAGADVFVAPVLVREKVAEARHVITCTQHSLAHLERVLGAPLRDRATTILHGLDLAAYAPARGPAESPPMILSVGQLTERKGLSYLVRACDRLRERDVPFRCRIVGEGPERASLEALISRSSLEDRVTLCGALRHEEVVSLYRTATIFVLPCVLSKSGDVDGIPNALAEAMASGLPVIGTTLPAIEEIISHGVTGWLVPPADAAALADAIMMLVDRPGMRARLGTNGRRTIAERFDIESNVRRLVRTLWSDALREVST